jgi:hypothetical protein
MRDTLIDPFELAHLVSHSPRPIDSPPASPVDIETTPAKLAEKLEAATWLAEPWTRLRCWCSED